MSILLSHTTALEALRRWDLQERVIGRTPRETHVPNGPPPPEEFAKLVRSSQLLSSCERPINILVSENRLHGRGGLVKAHLISAPLPPGSSVDIGLGVSCVSPELLSVLMAPGLTDLELVLLLSELLGTYAICPAARRGMFGREQPLVVPGRLREYLDSLGGVSGTAKVGRALSVACVKSASPMETRLSLRLGLRPARGGYGFEVLSMNEPLEVERVGSLLSKGTRRPDILLRRPGRAGGAGYSGVAVEYNGGDHERDERVYRDIRRSNELKALGLKEYEISSAEYNDLDYMDWIAGRIREDLGMPKQELTRSEAARRRRRREDLYEELTLIDGVTWDGRKRAKARVTS